MEQGLGEPRRGCLRPRASEWSRGLWGSRSGCLRCGLWTKRHCGCARGLRWAGCGRDNVSGGVWVGWLWARQCERACGWAGCA
eukprot:2238947-Prymnesium_polylepis.1